MSNEDGNGRIIKFPKRGNDNVEFLADSVNERIITLLDAIRASRQNIAEFSGQIDPLAEDDLGQQQYLAFVLAQCRNVQATLGNMAHEFETITSKNETERTRILNANWKKYGNVKDNESIIVEIRDRMVSLGESQSGSHDVPPEDGGPQIA